MEIAGLTLGVVALASLFQDCVDLFAYISAARSMGGDYEVLNTILDVEKTILLQWAERVRLFEPSSRHPLLKDQVVAPSVVNTLEALQSLLSQGQELEQRYGLKCATEGEAMNGLEAFILSQHRMASLNRAFKAMNFNVSIPGHHGQARVPIHRRIRWVAKDKERFENLLRQLSYFISKLNQIIPEYDQGLTIRLTAQDMGLLKLQQLKMLHEATVGRFGDIADAADKAIVEDCQKRILDVLWYRAMDLRRAQVTESHAKPFDWALQPSTPGLELKWEGRQWKVDPDERPVGPSNIPPAVKSLVWRYGTYNSKFLLLFTWNYRPEVPGQSFASPIVQHLAVGTLFYRGAFVTL